MQKTKSILINSKENIALIGMPASGKSTIGNHLAKQIGFKFLDSDDIIQSYEKQTLAQIVSEKGLSRFLKIEEHHVIATGGSVVYSKKTMAHLFRISTIVYFPLNCPGS